MDFLALDERLGVGVAVVERVGPGAVGGDLHLAVGADDVGGDVAGHIAGRGAGGDADHGLGVGVIDVGVVVEHVAAGGGIAGERVVAGIDAGLGDRIAAIVVGERNRLVVGADDGDVERGGRGRPVGVRHRVGEDVVDFLALDERLGVGVAVVERVGPGAVGGDLHLAVGADDVGGDVAGHIAGRGAGGDADHGLGVGVIDVGVVVEHVAAGGGIAGERVVAGIDAGLGDRIAAIVVGERNRLVVGADDGDGRASWSMSPRWRPSPCT